MRYIAQSDGTLTKAISKREDVSPADKKRAVAEYGKVNCADMKNKKYPLDTAEHVRAAASYWGMPKNKAKYSPEEQKTISKRIKAAEKRLKIGEFAKSRLVIDEYGRLLMKSGRRKGKPKTDIERVMTHYNVNEAEAKKMLKKKSVNKLLPERGSALEEPAMRRKGKPRTDIERVMNHYNVDEKTAKKMLSEKSVDELLPERGAGLEKSNVKAHQKRTKTGKLVNIGEYQTSKEKKEKVGKGEHIKGLKKWVNDYQEAKKHGNEKLAAQIKNNITSMIIRHKINPSDVWGKSLSKSLEFDINGKELIEGLKSRIALYKKQYKTLVKDNDSSDNSAFYKKEAIKRFQKVIRRLEPEKFYKLGLYDMEEYGLLKSLTKEDLTKSLEFKITGQRIREGIMMKIGELKAKLAMLKIKQKQGIEVKDLEALMYSNEDVKEPVNDWEIKSCERNIDRLERIVRNIEPKKKFKLSTYELEEYGL